MANVDRSAARGDWLIVYVSAVFACTVTGLLLAVFLIVVASVIWAGVGEAEMTAKYGPLSDVVRAYFKGCGISGLLVGLLSPLSKWRTGIVFISWIGSAALYLVVFSQLKNPLDWRDWKLLDVGLMLLVVAPLATVVSIRAVKEFYRPVIKRPEARGPDTSG